MRCEHCGHTIETDSKFCRHCGKSVASKAGASKAGNKAAAGKKISLQGKHLIYAVAYGAWAILNAVMWIAACLSDSHATGSRYFYPFGWSDYSSYDGSEFFVYVVVLPALVAITAYNWDWIKAMARKDAERLKRKNRD